MQKFTQLIGCRLNYTQANKDTAIWLGHFSDKQGSKSLCMLISITKERNGIEPWTSKGSLFSSFWTDCAAHQYVWKLVLTTRRFWEKSMMHSKEDRPIPMVLSLV